ARRGRRGVPGGRAGDAPAVGPAARLWADRACQAGLRRVSAVVVRRKCGQRKRLVNASGAPSALDLPHQMHYSGALAGVATPSRARTIMAPQPSASQTIDVHAHILTEETIRLLQREAPKVAPKLTDIDDQFGTLDVAGSVYRN